MAEAQTLNDFWPRLAREFYDNGSSVNFTPLSLELFTQALAVDTFADLTLFPNMTEEQILSVVRKLTREGSSLERLVLGRLSQEALKSVLENHVGLKTALYITDDKSLSPKGECTLQLCPFASCITQQRRHPFPHETLSVFFWFSIPTSLSWC